jgi:hypothetical protein
MIKFSTEPAQIWTPPCLPSHPTCVRQNVPKDNTWLGRGHHERVKHPPCLHVPWCPPYTVMECPSWPRHLPLTPPLPRYTCPLSLAATESVGHERRHGHRRLKLHACYWHKMWRTVPHTQQAEKRGFNRVPGRFGIQRRASRLDLKADKG